MRIETAPAVPGRELHAALAQEIDDSILRRVSGTAEVHGVIQQVGDGFVGVPLGVTNEANRATFDPARHVGGIAILLDNDLHYMTICWAAQRSGLYYTPISTLFQNREINYILDNSDAKLLITKQTILDWPHRLMRLFLSSHHQPNLRRGSLRASCAQLSIIIRRKTFSPTRIFEFIFWESESLPKTKMAPEILVSYSNYTVLRETYAGPGVIRKIELAQDTDIRPAGSIVRVDPLLRHI